MHFLKLAYIRVLQGYICLQKNIKIILAKKNLADYNYRVNSNWDCSSVG